jgi:hypothetical protein
MTRDQIARLPHEGSERCVQSAAERAVVIFEPNLEVTGSPWPDDAHIEKNREQGDIGHG